MQMSFSLATYSNNVLSSAPLPSIHNVSASPLSPPPTPYHPTSTFSLFHSISFTIENPDAEISTTSLVPTTTSNSTLPVTPSNQNIPRHFLPRSVLHPSPPLLLGCLCSLLPHKATFLSQTSALYSAIETLEDIQIFPRYDQRECSSLSPTLHSLFSHSLYIQINC